MKRAFSLTETLVVIAGLILVVGFAWPILSRPRPNRGISSCQSNLKQIGLGLAQYAQDSDERYPPARVTSSVGWVNLLQPYVPSPLIFHCPAAILSISLRPAVASTGVVTTAFPRFFSDYFYNRQLAGVWDGNIRNPTLTLMAGDGQVFTTSSSLVKLPSGSTTNSHSPAQRHSTNAWIGGSGAANYLFVDRHVQLLKPDVISNAPSKPDSSDPTFAVR